MEAVLKVSPEQLEKVERERLTFLVLPKTDLEAGEKFRLVAYGSDVEGKTGYLAYDPLYKGYKAMLRGWSGRCSNDSRYLTTDEADGQEVRLLSKLDKLDDEAYLYDYDQAMIQEELGQAEIPDDAEVLFLLKEKK
ncbi:hypothetical protein [Lactococcus termiticola]|uniref:Uncharacterized protein n=1 Tax=Lactococcus termiticola TaxID=2169526 RepID=A0A2R5HFJ2_9LACT|nr:hypothetical protein [Lactococcus termiticola]GBG96817.1 hypothetical protein NtB2_00941 [Lactococcus termiticola]